MIPEHIRGTEGRGNIPVWVFAAGVIALILLVFFGWIAVGMVHQPTAEPVTQDIPLAH